MGIRDSLGRLERRSAAVQSRVIRVTRDVSLRVIDRLEPWQGLQQFLHRHTGSLLLFFLRVTVASDFLFGRVTPATWDHLNLAGAVFFALGLWISRDLHRKARGAIDRLKDRRISPGVDGLFADNGTTAGDSTVAQDLVLYAKFLATGNSFTMKNATVEKIY